VNWLVRNLTSEKEIMNEIKCLNLIALVLSVLVGLFFFISGVLAIFFLLLISGTIQKRDYWATKLLFLEIKKEIANKNKRKEK